MRANAFHYLTGLQRNAEELTKQPRQWMPWNYFDTLLAGYSFVINGGSNG